MKEVGGEHLATWYYSPKAQHEYYLRNKEKHRRYAESWWEKLTVEERRAEYREARRRYWHSEQPEETLHRWSNRILWGDAYDDDWLRTPRSIKHVSQDEPTSAARDAPDVDQNVTARAGAAEPLEGSLESRDRAPLDSRGDAESLLLDSPVVPQSVDESQSPRVRKTPRPQNITQRFNDHGAGRLHGGPQGSGQLT